MSTTRKKYQAVGVEVEECPHGVPNVDENPLRCFYCWREAETGSMALTDPRREA